MPIRPNILAMHGYVPGEQLSGQGIIKLNTNESPYPPSPKVFEAIQQTLTGEKLRKYPEALGQTFRKKAGQVLQVDPDSILIGNGSDDILTIVTRAFVPQGGLIVSPSPSYVLYRSLAEIQGARFQTVSFTPDWQLPKPFPVQDADLIFLANPNSPSGTMIDSEGIQQLLDSTDSPLILDEAYVDFASHNGLRFASQRALVSRTLSKSYALAGIRFGYGVADPSLIHELLKVKDSYNCDVLSLAAATAALEDQTYLQETCQKILSTRNRMAVELPKLGFQVTPSQTNFLWCQRADRPVKPIYETLRERRILVRYMNYPNYGDGLRISVGSDPEIDQLLDTLKSIL